MASNSCPVTARSPSSKMPIWAAIAAAVTLWSPVIITGRIPASLAVRTASAASSRGGSIIATSPINVNPFSSSSVSSSPSSTSLYANASTRRPFSENSWFCRRISSFILSLISRLPPLSANFTLRSSRTSTAPLVSIVDTPCRRYLVLISLRSESKAISSSLGIISRMSSSETPAFVSPAFCAIVKRQLSVGSPISLPFWKEASLFRIALYKSFRWSGSIRSSSSGFRTIWSI